MSSPSRFIQGALAKLRGYHGSPYDFDKFDLSKAGTGEGTAAYGHGAYLSEHPKTAQYYRDLAEAPELGTPEESAYSAMKYAQGDRAMALQMLEYDVQNGRDPLAAQAHKLLSGGWTPPRGKMYEVEVNAGPDQLLDWETRIADQPKDIQDKLSQLTGNVQRLKLSYPNGKHAQFMYPPGEEAQLEDFISRMSDTWSKEGSKVERVEEPLLRGDEVGASLYSRLARSKPAASERLKGVGIPGLKYLDQGSRFSGKGTSNYVIFDPELITILRKYGLLPLAAGLGVAGDGEDDAQ
jgi:hypothetical protein